MATAVKKAKSIAGPGAEVVPLKPKNETLKRLGIEDPREALLCLPESFSDLRTITKILPDEDDDDRRLYSLRFTGDLEGFDSNKRVCDLTSSSGWARTFRLKIGLVDDAGNAVSWSIFGNPWPYRDLAQDEYLSLVGKVQYFGKTAYLQDVELPPSHAVGKIWVKYLGIQGRVAGEKVESHVRAQLDNPDAFKHCVTKLIGALGMMDKEAMEAAGASEFFSTYDEVIRALHRPIDTDQGWMAKIVANKLAAMAVQAAALRHNIRHPHPDAPMSVDVQDIAILARTQKETLTKSQMEVATHIATKLRAPRPMNALLSGDVGTGKTLAYLLPAVAAHRAGAKVAIIAPTSILADQIARQIVDRFGAHVKGVERIGASGKIADHASILVGTPGITTVCTKSKYTPNLLILDEQHKMGTAIREKLVKPWTHTLEVSATPIPRSLASALFGGKELLNLRECPVKKEFDCLVGDVSMRPKFSAMIKHALQNGERAAVVYPRINSSFRYKENIDGEMIKKEMESVLSGAAALEKAFPGQVVSIHGGMKDEEIALAIEQVRSGAKPLVVASSVIETGVDIPGITTMIVRDADYFGVSQLHQLRGRLVRHGGHGLFGMMVRSLDELAPQTYELLQIVAQSTDGYELAERDLVCRGFGELEGDSQSGEGSSETVFRLVKLRPDDFLRKKLSKESLKDHSVDLSAQRAAEQEAADEVTKLRMQPRLFA